jgi:hypothetical protein
MAPAVQRQTMYKPAKWDVPGSKKDKIENKSRTRGQKLPWPGEVT